MGKRVFDVLPDLLKKPNFRAEYDALEQEFSIARALIEARLESGMTQVDVAQRMGVSQPVVARLESGKNVSVKSLRRYARAINRPIPILIQPEP